MENEKLSKAEQARINGAKSTGPKTPEGLQRCREASVKHGMWVAHISTFPYEDQVAYAALLTSATDQLRPRNCVESAVVGLLVDALWRAGKTPTRDTLVAGLESISNANFGGFRVDFSPRDHVASHFVDLSMLTEDGKVRR